MSELAVLVMVPLVASSIRFLDWASTMVVSHPSNSSKLAGREQGDGRRHSSLGGSPFVDLFRMVLPRSRVAALNSHLFGLARRPAGGSATNRIIS